MFELSICAMHRVGIDGDLSDHLTDRRELIASLKLTALNGIDDLIHELAKGRPIRPGIETKNDGGVLALYVLVH